MGFVSGAGFGFVSGGGSGFVSGGGFGFGLLGTALVSMPRSSGPLLPGVCLPPLPALRKLESRPIAKLVLNRYVSSICLQSLMLRLAVLRGLPVEVLTSNLVAANSVTLMNEKYIFAEKTI